MGDVRVRITAVKDRSFDTVFRSIEDQAKRASTALASTGDKGGTALARGTKKGANEAERAIRDLEREMKGVPKVMDAGAKAAADFGKEASRSFAATKREFDLMARDVERGLDKMSRAQRGFSDKRPRGGGGSFIQGPRFRVDPVSAAATVGGRALRAGAGIGKDIAMGAGLDPSLAGAVGRSVSLQSRAVALSNSAYMPSQSGANAQRVDPSALMAQAKQIGNAAAFDPDKVLEGLQKFVAKTGDLETGRAALSDLAILSKATSTELDDMVDAAGDVANALGNTDNKGAKVKAVMGAIAAQGKEGAVEIKDLARQMAKLGASAGTFEGDPTKVIGQMGALAQMSRAKGGSASATQAATSVTSFMNTFSKGARLDKMEKEFGLKVRGSSGKVRDPKELITEAIRAAADSKNGGMGQFDKNMGKMFADVRARSVTRGFETIYKEAGGGEEGIKAVQRAFERLENATVANTEVQESFRRAMGTTESQMQLANNSMAELGQVLLTAAIPAFQGITPSLVAFSSWIAKITGQTESNEQKRGSNAELTAMGDASRLRGLARQAYSGEKGLTVAGDVFDKTDQSKAELEKVLLSEKRKLTAASAKVDTYLGGTAAPGTVENMSNDIEAMKQLERSVSLKEETLQDLKTSQSALLTLVRDGLIIKQMPEPKTVPKAPPPQSVPEH